MVAPIPLIGGAGLLLSASRIPPGPARAVAIGGGVALAVVGTGLLKNLGGAIADAIVPDVDLLGPDEGAVGAPVGQSATSPVDGGLAVGDDLVARIIDPPKGGQVTASLLGGTYEVEVEVRNDSDLDRPTTVTLSLQEQTVSASDFALGVADAVSLLPLGSNDEAETLPNTVRVSIFVPARSVVTQRVAIDLAGGKLVLKARVLAEIAVAAPGKFPFFSSSTWFWVVRI